MIPIRDTAESRRTPAATIFIIGMNVALFLIAVPLLLSRDFSAIFATPQRVVDCGTFQILHPTASCSGWEIWRSIFSALFLHVGAVHIAGNMYMLWLFGKNVEDRLGRVRFVAFYLLSGVGATMAYVFLNKTSTAPVLGASGAIAGAIGAYLLMFPGARITTLSVSFGGRRELRKMMHEGPAGAAKSRLVSIAAVDIPAWILAAFYFVLQLSQNYLRVAHEGPSPAVAYEAHIGGFLAGMVALLLLAPREVHPSVRALFSGRPLRTTPAEVPEEKPRAGSAATGWRALELFTDRAEPIRRFTKTLENETPAEKVIFFHGDGGNGKSLLLRHLAERCTPVPHALLDLAAAPRGDDRPQEAFSALLMLRRALAGRAFPLFDFACVHYLHATGASSPERLKSLFPDEERNFIASVADVVAEQHWVAESALEMITRRLGTSLDEYAKRRKIDPATIEAIERLDPATELIDELPALFARDLNASMSPGDRVVLFFDGHEAFWAGARFVSDHLFFERDEWLRRLLVNVDLAAGIVCVVAGREPPRWDKAPVAKIGRDRIELHRLDFLPLPDATSFLEAAGISDEATRRHILAIARVGDQIHPLYLGLCADVVANSRDGGGLGEVQQTDAFAEKAEQLVARLLRYVDDEVGFAVRALAAARWFDRDVYVALGEALNFKATDPSFAALLNFSFVWRTDRTGTFRVHDLLRRLAREREDDVLSRADAALERFHRARAKDGDIGSVVEAVYHASMSDPPRGAAEWLSAFTNGLARNRLELCRALLVLRKELPAGDMESARMARASADFSARLARYDEARGEYDAAISSYDRALASAQSDAEALRGKGDALRRLGELEAKLSRYPGALSAYDAAADAYRQALKAAPDDPRALRSQSNVQRAHGELLATMQRPDEAIAAYRAAISSAETVVRSSPADVRAANALGVTLRSIADLYAATGRPREARAGYKKGLAALDAALIHGPDDVEVLNNKGMTLRGTGDLDAAAGRTEPARKGYAAAAEVYERALKLSPDYVYAHNNLGSTLRALGTLHAAAAQHEAALERFGEALAAHDEALRIAPDYIYAHNNRGAVLSLRAESLVATGRKGDAAAALREALSAYDAALAIAPDYRNAQSNKAAAQKALTSLTKRPAKSKR
ncbi:MAG: rhomboid family intramembrane serine protease [Actinomycetota bacterium]|nr:rhomboid family intramembrane serine protease [Actinomycetota bacterium]